MRKITWRLQTSIRARIQLHNQDLSNRSNMSENMTQQLSPTFGNYKIALLDFFKKEISYQITCMDGSGLFIPGCVQFKCLKKPLLWDKNPKNSGYNALNIFINVQLFCQETKEVDLKKKYLPNSGDSKFLSRIQMHEIQAIKEMGQSRRRI